MSQISQLHAGRPCTLTLSSCVRQRSSRYIPCRFEGVYDFSSATGAVRTIPRHLDLITPVTVGARYSLTFVPLMWNIW
jgi:hypothetical protein